MQRSTLLTLLLALAGLFMANQAVAFELKSPDIKDPNVVANTHVFKGFGCSGENQSPALAWSGAPEDTKSFAVLVHDPDAPTGGAGWWHWLVYNLPAATTGLPRDAGRGDNSKMVKGAVQVKTDFGAPGWGGPCPPAGDAPHRYVFTVYALKVPSLDIAQGSSASLVGFMVGANTLAKAQFVAKYGRKK